MHRLLVRISAVWDITGSYQCPAPNRKGGGVEPGQPGSPGKLISFLPRYHHNADGKWFFRHICFNNSCSSHKFLWAPHSFSEKTLNNQMKTLVQCLGRWLLMSKYRSTDFFLLNHLLVCLTSLNCHGCFEF